MTNNFPPHSTRMGEIKALLNALSTAAGSSGAIYLSAPITSGKRHSAWRLLPGGRTPQHGQDEEAKNEAIEHNRAHAAQIVQGLRSSYNAVVIDPTRLEDLPGWTQDDYRTFWALVIERFACKVLFIDDWQYSNGCSYEFLTAWHNDVPTLDERQCPLSLKDGMGLLRSAITEMQQQSLNTFFLERILEELTKLRSPETEALCTK